MTRCSRTPIWAAWLVGEHLIRQFVVTVDNVANGRNPAQQLAVLRLERRFRATGEGEQSIIDPASYQRYDLFATVVGALDPPGAALLYVTLEPLLDEAHRELGYPGHAVPDHAGARGQASAGGAGRRVAAGGSAARHAVPVRRRASRALTPAQKQFIGMGPDNVLVVQAQLRAIAGEIGLILE